MRLNELFVSHKQVEPVQVGTPKMPEINPIYMNLDRAQKVASQEQPTESTEESVSPQPDSSTESHWVVGTTSKPTTSQTSGTVSTGEISRAGLTNRAKYWMDIYAKLGLDTPQQIAMVSAMMGECGLNPKGAVEKTELAGKGNTKAGWAHAGEGAIGLTHWDTKKKYIQMYNDDPRRKGPKLSTNETEYSKASSRHIADLDDEDQALIAFHVYKNILDRSETLSFQDLIGDFYLQKAGRGFGKGAGNGASLYDQAMHTGTIYQKSHAKLGYTKASQTNSFVRTLGWAQELADIVGYQYS